MTLGCDLVRGALAKRFACAAADDAPAFEVRRPLLWTGDLRIEAGGLYISEKPHSALYRDDVLAVFASADPMPEVRSGVYVCASAAQVFNFLQQLFDQYDAWAQRMNQLAMNQSGLKGLLEAAREMLVNPIIVLDGDFSPAIQSGEMELSAGNRAAVPDREDIDAFAILKTDPIYTRQCNAGDPFLYSEVLLGRRFWSVRIDGLPAQHQLLLVESVAPLKSGDGMLLKSIVPLVRNALMRNRSGSASDNRLADVIQQMLTDHTADQFRLSDDLARLGWKADHEYFCLALRLIRRENQGLSMQQIVSRIRRRYPDSCPLIHHEMVVCYFNATLLGKSIETISGELTVFIRDELLNAGYSRAMFGHKYLQRQFIQAQAALEVGSRVQPHIWIHHFDSISMRFLLDEAVHRLPAEMICHPGLLALRAHDSESGTEYMQTLRVYLQQNLNAVRSARTLFIHRSTFLYRLERICEILDSTLDDPEEIAYLSVSYMLLDRTNPHSADS